MQNAAKVTSCFLKILETNLNSEHLNLCFYMDASFKGL